MIVQCPKSGVTSSMFNYFHSEEVGASKNLLGLETRDPKSNFVDVTLRLRYESSPFRKR